MNLLPAGKDYYSDYFLGQNHLDIYKDDNGAYKITPLLAAEVLLPLVLQYYRYEPKNKIWYRFNGVRFDDSEHLFTDVKDSLNDMKERCSPNKQYFGSFSGIHNAQFLSKVLEILQKSYATHIELPEFDADTKSLNTPDGYFDLLTRGSEPNSIRHLCRKITEVAPDDDQNGLLCPNYMNHLRYVSQDDQTVMNYIEGLSGYILTGETFLQTFYWFYGSTGTGKSAITSIWRYILGGENESSYFWLAPNTQFARKHHDPHPELEMRLMGKRYVLVEELEDRQWNEAKLKTWTSGNPVTARDMGGKSINFMPQCKLVFTSNKLPDIDASDGAIVRRLRMFEFMKNIPPEMDIKKFAEKCLYPEAPYILNRMMKAAQQVLLTESLPPIPQRFLDLAKEYVDSNNIIASWRDDQCDTGHELVETFKNIQAAVAVWCADNGYESPSPKKLQKILGELGHKQARYLGNRARTGLKLKDTILRKIELRANSYAN